MAQVIENVPILDTYGPRHFSNPWSPFPATLPGQQETTLPVIDAKGDEVAYPRLSASELCELAGFGETCSFCQGENLVQAGEPASGSYVLVSGSANVIDTSNGNRRIFTRYGAGCFTGDVYVLTNRSSVVTIEAATDIESIRFSPAKIRELIVRKPHLGDRFWRAFQRRRQLLLASDFRGLSVFGTSRDPATLEVAELLTRNMVPYEWLDIEVRENRARLIEVKPDATCFPVIAHGSRFLFQNPTLVQLAEYLGIRRGMGNREFDVVILGAGPSGLGAAVHASSEGLSTLVLDAIGPGGQAGASSQIENYAGFPGGVSGSELANLTYLQALKFGAEFAAPCTVSQIERRSNSTYMVRTVEGDAIIARTIIIAVGVSYRHLDVDGLKGLYGAGVYHSATAVEALRCKAGQVHVVGAGNAAGQAAMFLSQYVNRVSLIVRSNDLRKSMSSYLAERVLANRQVVIRYGAEVTSVRGDECLAAISYRSESGEVVHEESSALFIFVGARPRTDALPSALGRDQGGFLLTGAAASKRPEWKESRCPSSLETTLPGVFAAGDCRSGATKRVAAAIGDGALAVNCVHEFLSQMPKPT
jgi:thioredoxin reductase (NADPH)